MAYFKNKKMTPSPNRFTNVEDNKELLYRFAKRDRKRKIAYDRDTKFKTDEVVCMQQPTLSCVLVQDKATEEEIYNAWEEHIKFLENQQF